MEMSDKKWLPLWTDGLNYEEQHMTFWIANNMERIAPIYSFLPIRMPGDFFCNRKNYHYSSMIKYFPEGRASHFVGKVMPLEYYAAEKSFDQAAREFFLKYPESTNVTFGKLNFNGIYDTEFEMDYNTRLALFKEILDSKIEKNCILDEVFELTEIPSKRPNDPPEYSINAILDLPDVSVSDDFEQVISSCGFPYIPKKQVRIKKDNIYSYYYTVPEKIFVLGNQYIKYRQNSEEYPEFFSAADNRDLSEIKNHINAGIDINMIDSSGQTVFSRYINGRYAPEKEANLIDDLEVLLYSGANPAIFGAGYDSGILDDVCVYVNDFDDMSIISFLLECGVSPHSFASLDEPCEDIVETLMERTERWATDDFDILDDGPDEFSQKVLELFQKYA